jgi:hypothetical protein
MSENDLLAREVWDEAKQNAFARHGEGIQTALDIALNDRRAVSNSSVRQAIRDLCEAEKKPNRRRASSRSRMRVTGTVSSLQQLGSSVPKRY